MTEVEDGLVLMLGTQAFEEAFGPARLQKVPSDAGIQFPNSSSQLDAADGSAFGSTMGLCT